MNKKMNKKVILGIMLSVIIASAMSTACNLPTARAQEPPIEIWSDYTLDRDITFSRDGFIVKADNITLDLNGHTITGSGVGDGVNLTGVDRVIVKNGKIDNFYDGIESFGPSNSMLVANTVSNCGWNGIYFSGSEDIISQNTCVNNSNSGIELLNGKHNSITRNCVIGPGSIGISLGLSDVNTVTENYIMDRELGINVWGGKNVIDANTLLNNNVGIYLNLGDHNSVVGNKILSSDQYGIWVDTPNYNTIRGNTIASGRTGICVDSNSSNNTIYYNNFIENAEQVEGNALANNIWDDGGLYKCPVCGQKRSEGNYWSDYGGRDDGSHTQAHNCLGDGIGDTDTPHLGVDKYPVTVPWVPIEGDINLDGVVDIVDITMAAINFGKTT